MKHIKLFENWNTNLASTTGTKSNKVIGITKLLIQEPAPESFPF